jgi:hypothetical protein
LVNAFWYVTLSNRVSDSKLIEIPLAINSLTSPFLSTPSVLAGLGFPPSACLVGPDTLPSLST